MSETNKARKPWPAERVEMRPVDGLIENARNARTHSEEQVAQIAGSIAELPPAANGAR